MKCSACLKTGLRTTQRALIVVGPAKTKPGRVCKPCAATGILLVFGGEEPKRKRHKAAPRETVLGSLGATPSGQAVAPQGERCKAHTDKTRRRCMLPEGHDGCHRSLMGGAWSETA